MDTRGIRNSFRAAAPVVGVLAVLCICADVQAQTCTPDFLITPTPNGPQSNRLRAVAAFDVSDVWAVGFANGRQFQTSNYQTLIERWDGSSWSIVPSPNQGVSSQLSGVAGIATNDLWAVGSFNEVEGFSPSRTLTEHWDGVQWSVVPSPSLEGFDQLNAVAAVASDDVWAVGQDSALRSLFLHWDGQAWTIIDGPPNSGPQNAVAALATDDFWSAGFGQLNHWDGTSWSTIPSPPIAPKGLSAIASNDVWASGSLFHEVCEKSCYNYETPRVLHWDGQSWAATDLFGYQARLSGIAAESSASVWSVGGESGHTLAFHWDGKRWTSAPELQLGVGAVFEGVAVVGGDAWAVGWFVIPGRDQTLAVRFRCN
jgi:hypothetical protein